ncbi:MAG: division/cell wall cluster transcriptional repressor MraZ [Candidatus Woykebacteria bacterium]
MFLGEYKHSIDYKGRVSVPKKFRAELGKGSVLTKGLDRCLFLYTKQAWESLSQSIRSMPVTASDARAFSRYLFSGAIEIEFDQLGRIFIPEYLRSYSSIKKEVVIVGVLERVEIWDKKTWGRVSKGIENKGEEIAEKLTGAPL